LCAVEQGVWAADAQEAGLLRRGETLCQELLVEDSRFGLKSELLRLGFAVRCRFYSKVFSLGIHTHTWLDEQQHQSIFILHDLTTYSPFSFFLSFLIFASALVSR